MNPFVVSMWLYLIFMALLGYANGGIIAALGFSCTFLLLIIAFPPKEPTRVVLGVTVGAVIYVCITIMTSLFRFIM